MILHEDTQDTESQDVIDNSDNDTEMNDNGGESESDAVSSDSSTPLMALKKAKMRKQQEAEEKRASEKARMRKNKKSVTSTTVASGKAGKKTQNKATVRAKSTTVKPSGKLSSAKSDTKHLSKEENKREASEETVSSQKSEKTDDGSIHSSESEEEEEEAACCLCHCGVDCSDRALFFAKDRKLELEEDEDYYFGLDDPYLDGEKFYDRNNALVYCDTCNRLYHQKCHFVPLLVVPRGEFHCLICSIQNQQKKTVLQGKKSPSKKRERKGSIKSTANELSTIPEKFLKRKITDQLFQSPPTQSSESLDIKTLEHDWEVVSGPAKARLWELQFKQLRTFLKSQASNIRMANTTLATMTSTKRNRQHFLESSTKTGTKSSQELAQTLCKLTGAKLKIREALLSLESLRVNNESIDFQSLYSWCQGHPEHANHVFPFGSTYCKDERRIVPRTRERKKEDSEKQNKKSNDIVPSEITINGSKSAKSPPRSKKGEKKSTRATSHKEEKKKTGDDDDSGITLDDLQCAVCRIGDATDENDVLLCDGKDCHRAYHMKCVYPPVKQEDIENEDEDWFCPICSHSAELMGEIHDLCVGDENDEASTGSWEDVHDVFPGSQWEYETAQKILKGKRNEDTQRLLTMFLGEDINKKKVQMPIGSDSEDENDYSLFDEDSFQERRKQERDEKSDDDDSICSSQATLQEMDDIDYKVGKAELMALSEGEGSESDNESDDESESKIRRSRRLEKKDEVEESNAHDVGADFDESNIIIGKRKRKRVNYRKLNDMMFGDLSDHQQGIIDGGDDFDAPSAKPMKTESDNESGEDGSDNRSDDESGDDGSDGGSDNESDGNSNN